jgi:hypothetical protein
MAEQKNTKMKGTSPAIKITKVEALRRALDKLGQDAKTDDIQAFLKKRFGIEMTKDHIYVSRGDIRKKMAKKKTMAKPEARAQPASRLKAKPATALPSRTGEANGRRPGIMYPTAKTEAVAITKIASVGQALKELGKDATSLDIQGFLKKRFGLEISREHITKYKGDIHRKMVRKGKPAKSGAAKPVAGKVVPVPQVQPSAASQTKASAGKGVIQLDDILLVKELIGRVGIDNLGKLIAMFGK